MKGNTFIMKKRISLRPKRKNEIRYRSDYVKSLKKKVRHPKYIWRERGNVYDYHSMSHSQNVDGVEYKKLRKNPRPGDKEDAFYNPNSESDIKSNFGKALNWKLHPDDIKDIHNK